jgi:GT2 family glycosyltransferase
MPEISVIIVNWNGKHFLEACLNSLCQQTFRDFETILVDNGSADGSVEYVLAQFPAVNLISLNENRGFAAGNIAGYEHARGNLIVLLNNDTEADPLWLQEVHRGSREFPRAGSFASKMLYFDDRKRIENCGFGMTAVGMTVDLGRGELDGPRWSEVRKVFGACGGAVAYRRSMLEKVGFLDPDFFLIYEDVDLAFRAQLMGYECMFIPSAIVYHRLGATRKKNSAHHVFYSQRNIELTYFKNMPLGLILTSVPQRLFFELGGAAYFLKQGLGAAFLRAKIDVIRRLPALLRTRKDLQKNKLLADDELRSILLKNQLRWVWRKFSAAWTQSKLAPLERA